MVNRKFHLPDYESIDVAAEAELSETDNPLEIWSVLVDNAEMWFIDRQRKNKTATPPQTENPLKTESVPITPKNQGEAASQSFSDTTLQNIIILPDGDIQTTQRLDREVWVSINEELKQKGYKWVSAGKQSRWSQNQ